MMIKRAFTMLELVFVIAIVGILSALAIPRSNKDPLREAANQIMADIRYTQHLAMQDSKFVLKTDGTPESDWYKAYWRIKFQNAKNSGKVKWIYSIFSDSPAYDNVPKNDEMISSPNKPDKKISGLTNNDYDLSKKFGVTNIIIHTDNATKPNDSKDYDGTISFDNIGRPYKKVSNTSAYENLMNNKIHIDLFGNRNKLTIILYPQTGYTCIRASQEVINNRQKIPEANKIDECE
ncbi:pilus assembly FimT family protein [Campylobacter pinnipediorum]|uniref:pilus assembly FimT family protein n=1 Tax=Campylobacter pinnipediorum TaxID=1965231 RepID=UPI000994A1E1